VLPDDGTHLDLELRVESRAPQLLGLAVFGMLAPRPQRLLGRKLDDLHALPIVGLEGLEADEPGHALGEGTHLGSTLGIFSRVFRLKARAKNRHYHAAAPLHSFNAGAHLLPKAEARNELRL